MYQNILNCIIKNLEKKNKLIIVQEPVYNDDGSDAVSEIRSQDNKDRWIVRLNLEKYFWKINYQHDEAWIGGPGIPSSSFGRGTLGFKLIMRLFISNLKRPVILICTYNLKSKNQLTQGNWEVRSVALLKIEKHFTNNYNTSRNRSFYKLDISTKKNATYFN
jgi:hypothetical protein